MCCTVLYLHNVVNKYCARERSDCGFFIDKASHNAANSSSGAKSLQAYGKIPKNGRKGSSKKSVGNYIAVTITPFLVQHILYIRSDNLDYV